MLRGGYGSWRQQGGWTSGGVDECSERNVRVRCGAQMCGQRAGVRTDDERAEARVAGVIGRERRWQGVTTMAWESGCSSVGGPDEPDETS